MNSIACSILAGGKCSRMGGENKAFLRIDNNNILELAINVLDQIFDEIIIVTNSPDEFSSFKDKCEIITDVLKDKGPLGGIYSALLYTKQEALFVVPCDMPYLNTKLIQKEISTFSKSNCDALVPRVGKYMEPIHSIFSKRIVNELYSFLNSDQKYYIRKFLNNIDVQYFNLEDSHFHNQVFTNINTPEELERISEKQ